jgi:long-chain fatty acid transport protein
MRKDFARTRYRGSERNIPKSRDSLGLLLLLFAFPLSADELHYNNILIGDRASGLAGAYTAISDDATGLFYNPSGIVFTEELQLSASANAFHNTTLTYKDLLRGGDWKRESSNIIPNFFGITKKIGDSYFGFSYAVTDFEVENQDSRFTDITDIPLFIVNINNNEKVTKIGPSYALRINDRWNFGATLYYHNREKELINNQWIRLSDNSFESQNLYFEASEWGFEPVIGLMWSPTDEISLGLSLRKTFVSSSSSKTQVTCTSDVGDPLLQPNQCLPVGGSPIDPTITRSNDKRKLPLNVRVGIAYFPSPRLLYSADLSYYEEVDSSAFSAEEVINIALGIEYYFNAEWAVRGGYYTDNANTPDISSDELNQPDHVDLSGISVSVSRFSKTSSLTLGLAYAEGDGDAQVISGSPQIQDLEHTIETIYLSTSYSF